MAVSRLDPGLDPREWMRWNKAERHYKLEHAIALAVMRASDDYHWYKYRKRAEAVDADGRPVCGLDWLNARSPVAFGTCDTTGRTFAAVVSGLWKSRQHDKVPEIEVLRDLHSAYGVSHSSVALVVRYIDHRPFYALTTAPVLVNDVVDPAAVMRFGVQLDERTELVTLCVLGTLLDWMHKEYGKSYLHLGEGLGDGE